VHANKIRKFHVRVNEVLYDSVLFYNNNNDCECRNECDMNMLYCHCAIVCERNDDFGELCVLESPNNIDNHEVTESPPSSNIDPTALSHLSARQRNELLNVLDQFPECFSETPGLCNLVEHEITVTCRVSPETTKGL